MNSRRNRDAADSSFETSSVFVSAYHIADSINIRLFKAEFTGKLISSSSSELFYSMGNGYLYIFNYGVVAFADITDIDKTETLKHLKKYSLNPVLSDTAHTNFFDDFTIKTHGESAIRLDFDEIYTGGITPDIIKIVMFNVAQSVALDYYANESELLVERVNSYAEQMEKRGKVKLTRRNMLKFIGRTLNRKNRMNDNLYIFDVPESVWEDKTLTEINSAMIKVFDIKIRYREVQSNFKNIEDSLSIFMELYQHRMSNMLEWIIIILILIEVADLFITKLKPYF